MIKKLGYKVNNEIKTLWRGKPVSNLMKTLIPKMEEIIQVKLQLDVLVVGLKIDIALLIFTFFNRCPRCYFTLERDPNRNILVALICYLMVYYLILLRQKI